MEMNDWLIAGGLIGSFVFTGVWGVYLQTRYRKMQKGIALNRRNIRILASFFRSRKLPKDD